MVLLQLEDPLELLDLVFIKRSEFLPVPRFHLVAIWPKLLKAT